MRTKLLADRAAGNDDAFQKFLAERKELDGEKKNGFFSNMGKFVAKRWKELVSRSSRGVRVPRSCLYAAWISCLTLCDLPFHLSLALDSR